MSKNLKWPPNYNKEFKRRVQIMNAVGGDERAQQSLRVYYQTHPVEFINDWCVTYDPRNKPPIPKLMPFMLFPRQVDLVEYLYQCWRDGDSGLIEKCRDAGASWICCAFSLWLWLFHEGSAVGWGSRKEEYVDKRGDPKAIFPKIRQLIEYLPPFLKPNGYNENIHGTHMKIINPVNGSVITGEAGDNIGRGGRTSIYFKDESAHYPRPELVEAALGDNTDVQIDISSVNGTGNVFYRRRMAGEIWEQGKDMPKGKVRVFIFDWREHPSKTQDWYDTRRKRAEEEGLLHVFKQEVDRDYSGSVDRVVIPADWVRAAIDAHITLGFEKSGAVIGGQDVADGGGDKNALTIRQGMVAIHSVHWGSEAGEAARHSIPICNEYRVSELYYDSIGVGVGFKTEINTMKSYASWNGKLTVHPWDAGAKVLEPWANSIPSDEQSPLNKDQYANLKAQAWFRVRTRFYKTYRSIMHDEYYPPDELISLDSQMAGLQELITELSQVVFKDNGEGKTTIDKKPSGTKSPNLADSFIMAFNPCKEETYSSTPEPAPSGSADSWM